MKKFGLTFFIVLTHLLSGAQYSGGIKVFKTDSLNPIHNCEVQFFCLDCNPTQKTKVMLTNTQGYAKNPFMGITQVYITYLGLKPVLDTLKKGEVKTYQLISQAVEINNVVITAQYAPNSPDKSVHKVNIINRKKIDDLGAVTLKDVLTNEANIRISQDNVLGSSTSIQGLSGQNVKILIDGVPVVGRLGGNIDLSQINLNDIERIEIIEGPLSVEYGTNALAGTINLITKKNGKEKLKVGVNTYYETVGQYNIDGALKLRIGKNIFRFNGGRNFFDGWNPSDPFIKMKTIKTADSTRFNSWKPKEQKFFKAAHSGKALKFNYRFSSDYFREKITNKGQPRAPYNETAFDDFYHTDRWSNNLNLKRNLKKGGRLNMIFAYNYFRRQKNTHYIDLTTLQSNISGNASDQDTTKFDLFMARGSYSNSNDSSKLNYLLGYDFNVETGYGKRIKEKTQVIGDYALFSSLEYQPIKKLIIRPGLRYSYNTSYSSPLTPSFNLRYNIRNYIFRTSYSSGFRAPSIKDLYFNFIDSNHDIQGNPNLRAETSHNFSGSVVKTILKKNKVIKITASGFYNNINNLITLATNGGNSFSYFNLDKYKTLGTQAQLEFAVNRFKCTFSGVYTGRYNSLSESLSVNPFSYSPEFRSNFTYEIKKYNLNFAGFHKYSGEIIGYYIDDNDSIKQNLLGDFNTLDLTVTKGFIKNKIKFTLGGKNLFNVRNIVSRGESGVHSENTGSVSMSWGFSVFTSLKINLNGSVEKKTNTLKNDESKN